MVGRTVMFGPIIRQVCCAWAPNPPELVLGRATSQPMETHVHGLGAFWLDVACDNANVSGVVSLNWSGRLLMAHLCKCDAHWEGLARIDVGLAQLRLCC